MTDLSVELDKLYRWRLTGRRARAAFTAFHIHHVSRGRTQMAHVAVRRTRGESIEAMIWRALAELNRRLLDGMPKPRPEVVARRKLRDAPSPSRFTN